MNHYACNSEEPHYHSHHLYQSCRILSDRSIHNNGVEISDTDVQVEDGRNTDRSKEPYEECLPDMLDLRDIFVYCKDEWQSTKQENKDAERDQSVDWDDVVDTKACPWRRGTIPDEHSDVQ